MGSDTLYRGDNGEGTLGVGVNGTARPTGSAEPGREGNATLSRASGVCPRARGLGTRSVRANGFGRFKDATDACRGECVCDVGVCGAGLAPRALRSRGGTEAARGGTTLGRVVDIACGVDGVWLEMSF